jgi:hypothetical protein
MNVCHASAMAFPIVASLIPNYSRKPAMGAIALIVLGTRK